MNQTIHNKLLQHFDKQATRYFAKGEVIIQAGQAPTGISLLIEGVVEQYDITPEGNRLTVNMFRPSAFFPMSWAMNKTPNNYFFEAVSHVTLRQADTEATLEFLRVNPDVLFDLLGRVYKGTDTLLRRLVLAASGIAANRLVFELLIEAYRFGTDAGASERLRTIHIKQGVLAARSGLARETVSRELHKLENNGLINRSKLGITLDTGQLERQLDISI